MGAAWYGVAIRAIEDKRGESARVLVRAGLTAAPYLLRTQQWQKACALLERVIVWDNSPQTVAKAVQYLRLLVAAAPDTDERLHARIVLANTLASTHSWPQAESELRAAIKQAESRSDYPEALLALGGLRRLLGQTGRIEEALSLASQTDRYTQQAGFGPWTQLSNEATDLQLIVTLGRYEEVIRRADGLLDRMKAVEDEPVGDDLVPTWSVRESVLNAKHVAALFLHRWAQALSVNGEIERVQQARGATPLEIARTRLNAHHPLAELGRREDARAVLHKCRAELEGSDDMSTLERVYSALGLDEMALGHADAAAGFMRTALRYGYRAGDPFAIASNHANMAQCIAGEGGPAEDVLAHLLAAAILFHEIGAAQLTVVVTGLARVLQPCPRVSPPASFDDLCRVVERVESVRFRELFSRLPRRAKDGDEAVEIVLQAARQLADTASGT